MQDSPSGLRVGLGDASDPAGAWQANDIPGLLVQDRGRQNCFQLWQLVMSEGQLLHSAGFVLDFSRSLATLLAAFGALSCHRNQRKEAPYENGEQEKDCDG